MSKKYHILFLEDVDSDAELVKQELQQAKINIEFKHVKTERDFQKEIMDFKPDIILADYSLREYDGMRALTLAQKQAPMVPFIIVTGSVNEETAVDCIKAGATDYVTKEHLSRLGPAVRSAFEQMKVQKEKEQANEALRVSEIRYRTLTQATEDAIYIINRDDKIEFVNAFAANQFGLKPEDLIGKQRSEMFPSDVSGNQYRALQKVFESGESLSSESKIVYGQRERWLSTRLVPLKSDTGEIYTVLGFSHDITERKQAQDKLIRLKEFNESIVTGMAEGIIVQDADGKIIYINSATCDLLGYTEEELLGQHWSLIIPKDQHTIVHSADIRRKKGISDVYELQLIRKDGKQVEARASGSPHIEDGQFVGTIAVFTDITERNRTEKALRESEMRFRTIFESSPIGVLLTSPEGNFIHVNKHFEKMTMYSAEELNIHFKDITHPEDVDKSMIMLKNLLNGEIQSAKFEKRYIKKNGEVIHCNLNVAPVRIYGEKIEYFIATVEDTTKQKQAEESLIENEKRYRRVVENAIDIIFQHDIEGYFTFLNPVATRSTGYSEEELIGMHYTTLVHSDDLNHIKDFFERQFQERIKEGEYECRIVTKTGKSIWIRAHVTMLTEGNRIIGWQSIGRDVTDRKMAEEALHKAHELLQTTQNSLLDAVITTDMNYNIVSCNKAVMKIFGYTPEELIGKNYLVLASEEMSENADQETSQAELFEKGYLERDDFYFKRKNGKSFPASFSVALIKDEKGNATGLVGAVHDITERKEKEEKIKRQLDELQRWHRLILDREDRVQELKREVNELLKQQNQAIKYSSQEPNSGERGNDKR